MKQEMNPAVKPVNLDIAEKVIMDALDRVRSALNEHGHTTRSFTMISEMWTTYIKHVFTIRGDIELKAHDVAQMMVILKNVRSVYGFAHDNFVDEVGYSALAALLQQTPIEKKAVIKEQPDLKVAKEGLGFTTPLPELKLPESK